MPAAAEPAKRKPSKAALVPRVEAKRPHLVRKLLRPAEARGRAKNQEHQSARRATEGMIELPLSAFVKSFKGVERPTCDLEDDLFEEMLD